MVNPRRGNSKSNGRGGSRGRGGRDDQGNRGRGGRRGRGWEQRGGVRRGGGGRFRGRGSGPRGNAIDSSQVESLGEVQFIRMLYQTPDPQLASTILRFEAKWKACWIKPDAIPRLALWNLLVVMAKLPFSATVSPPPIHGVKNTIAVVLQGEKSTSEENPTKIIEIVEIVINIVVVRFLFLCF